MAYPQISFRQTSFDAPSFMRRKRAVVYAETLLYQLQVLKDTGRYDAFKLQWHPSYNDTPMVWPVPNHLFWDSDVAKWIEGACYFLSEHDNAQLHSAVDELVEMIRAAQQPDGYLNIHFTVVEPTKRFTNLRDLHELYNAGHLIEAALAHHGLYQNGHLLQPILKYVDLLLEKFGPNDGQKHGYPGHPEIELALIRLFERTNNPKHLALARYFVTERGNPTGQDGGHYYTVEAAARGEREHERPVYFPKKQSYWYQQAHKPLLEQETVEGHSVRVTYLLTAVSDLARISAAQGFDFDGYRETCERLWNNMVHKRMYLTGGIGSEEQYEGFDIDYFLPQGTDEGGCYAETCAAIGVMMLAERMLQIDLDCKYADVMELCFFNAVMTGMSANGKQFTYVNQLASSDRDLSKRAKWFTCACCPPNVTRLLGYIGGYLWTPITKTHERAAEINVHMYSSATLKLLVGDEVVELTQSSNWPWEGTVQFCLTNEAQVNTTIRLRIPAWAGSWQLEPACVDAQVSKGYLTLPAEWLTQNPSFKLIVPMAPRFVRPHPFVNQDIVALARGPLIFCLEDVDNEWVTDHFKTVIIDPTCRLSEQIVPHAESQEDFIKVTAHDAVTFLDTTDHATPDLPFRSLSPHQNGCGPAGKDVHFIPYYFRDNRGGRGHMRVGLRQKH